MAIPIKTSKIIFEDFFKKFRYVNKKSTFSFDFLKLITKLNQLKMVNFFNNNTLFNLKKIIVSFWLLDICLNILT